MDDLRKTAEDIYAQVSEPEFWGSWLLSDMRRGVDEEIDELTGRPRMDWNYKALDIGSGEKNAPTTRDHHGISLRVLPWERGPVDTKAHGKVDPKENPKEVLFDMMDWKEEAIEQIEWLLSIIHGSPEMHTFSEMLTEDPGQPADATYWAYAQKKGSGRRPKHEGRNFLKHWMRFVNDHIGVLSVHPKMGSLRGGGGKPTTEKAIREMDPKMRLAFLTARTMFPDLDHDDMREIRRENGDNRPWWYDPNGGFSPD